MSSQIPNVFLTNIPIITQFFSDEGRSSYLKDVWFTCGNNDFPVLETPLHLCAYLMIKPDARKQFFSILMKIPTLRPQEVSIDSLLQMINE